MCNAPDLHVRDEEIHHVRFSSGDGHPDVFRLDDVGELASSGRFFARKFDLDVDADVLDALDQRVFGISKR